MRNILLLLIVVFLGACRTLNGDYSETFAPPGGYADYHFNRNGTFTYSSRYDVGGEYGNGTYTVRCGRLKMKFDRAITEQYMSASWCFTNRDSAEKGRNFHVTVRDENKEPISFTVVSYGVSRDSLLENRVTDQEGRCQLVFKDDADSIFVRVRTGIHPSFEKEISVQAHDSIVLYLYPDPHWGQVPVDSGSVWKYNLRKGESKGLVLVEHRVEQVEVGDYRYKRVLHRDVHTLTKKKR